MDEKLEYFKKKILAHLDDLEQKENAEKKELKKSLLAFEMTSIEKAGYPVGTIREWKGKKYIKVAPGKWKPKYDSHSRGAKMAIAALKKKIDACTDSEELMQIILENRDRFSDENGRPLPFVKELSDYISGRNDTIESEKNEKKATDEKIKNHFEEQAQKYGVDVNVENGIVSISKDGKKFSHAFRYEEGKKDGHGEDWNDGAFGNLIIYARQEGLKTPKKEEPVKADSVKNALNNEEKVKFVNKLSGEVYHDYETDPSKFAVYAKDGKSKGLAMTQDIADIINSHSEASVYDWANAIAEDVNKKYPNIRKEYVKTSLSAIRMGYRNGDKEKVMILPDSKEEPKKQTLDTIRDKYKKAKSVTGNRKTIHVGDEKIKCHYKLVEADTPTASHDETTFRKTEGFPTVNGGSVNDNDYENSPEAKESVYRIAGNYDGRAIEDPPILTKDGIVVSGNNRTMSSKLAAKKGTDKEYIKELAETIEDYGIDEDELKNFKNPRLVLEIDEEHKGDYTTEEFAKYNRNGKKEKSVTEKAVVIAKTVKPQAIESIAKKISEFDTLGDLYNDRKATQDLVNTFIQNDIIQENEVAQYYDNNGLSANGKEFIETVLVGSIMNENNIRSLAGDGGKALRQKLVRGIVPLIENKGHGNEYSFNNELNKAVEIAAYVSKNHNTFPTISVYLNQNDMFEEKPSELTQRLAEIVHDSTQKQFAEQMKEAEGGIRPNARGEMDIFLGKCESRDSVLERILQYGKNAIKKAVAEVLAMIA